METSTLDTATAVRPSATPTSWKLTLGALAGVVLIALPLVIDNPSHQNLFILILMLAQLGVAWNILGGYAGQVSLGHAAFFGIGAYTSTMLLIFYGVNPWRGALVGSGVAVLASLLIGGPCFRLKGHYFAMATIAVAEIVQTLFNNWEPAGAAVGLTIPMDKQGFSTMVFAGKLPYYYLALGLLAVSLGVNVWVTRSRLGYYFRAIKDDPDAARSLGVSLTRYKLIALALSSFLVALGGSLYAQKELYIDPGSVLDTGLSIKMSLAAILGGVGTLFGPVVGAVALTLIEEVSRTVFGGTGRGTDLIIYAAVIVAISVYKPSGLIGWAREWLDAGRARRARKERP
jgi:branched-chain amino acid transport system permease protein